MKPRSVKYFRKKSEFERWMSDFFTLRSNVRKALLPELSCNVMVPNGKGGWKKIMQLPDLSLSPAPSSVPEPLKAFLIMPGQGLLGPDGERHEIEYYMGPATPTIINAKPKQQEL